MPTFNQGIRTEAGQDLFGRVDSGLTSIHYTKIVYSSLDLSNKSDDEIAQMTDVNPKELIVPNPSVLYKPKTATTDPETEIRAIGSNEILQKGFYINTYALFAADDSGHEILLGVTLDDHPSWLPAYDGVRPQALTYNWDIGNKDSNNVKFTDAHDAYATYGDLQEFSSAVDYRNDQASSNMRIDMNSYSSEFSSMKNDLINDSTVSNISSTVSQNAINISNYTDQKANSAVNQANANMETNRRNLQSEIDAQLNVRHQLNSTSPDGALDTITDTGVIGGYGANIKQGFPIDNFWGDVFCYYDNAYIYGYQIAVSVDSDDNKWFRSVNLSFNHGSFKKAKWHHMPNDADIDSLSTNIQNARSDLTQTATNDMRHAITVVENDFGSARQDLQGQIDTNNNHHHVMESNLQNQINNNVPGQINQAAANAMNQAISTANANMEANRSNLQGEINTNTQAQPGNSIDSNSPKNALDNDTATSIIGIHGGGKKQGLPQDKLWGDVQVYNPDWYGYAYQILRTIGSDVWYRSVNLGFNNHNFHNIAWIRVTEQVQAADNEKDAQNKSGQHPGTLFVYSD